MTGRLLPTSRQPGNQVADSRKRVAIEPICPAAFPGNIPSTAPPVPAAKLPAFVAVRFGVTAEVSGSARLYDLARHRRDGEVPDNPYQHEYDIDAI